MKMEKIIIIIVVCILLLSSLSFAASSDKNIIQLKKEKNKPITKSDTLDQSQELNTDMFIFGTLPSYYQNLNFHAYQSFTPQLGKLTRVEVLLSKDTDIPPFKDVNLVIRKELDGKNLTKATVSYSQIPSWENPEWIEFDFPDIQVTVGHTYYIICYVDWLPYGDTLFLWCAGIPNPYLEGTAGYSDDGGEDWYNYIDVDRCFRTYGKVPEIEIGQIKGGFGKVSAYIINNLDQPIEDIDCTITVVGGIFNKININSSFKIDSIPGGESLTISSDRFILGLGPVVIRFTVECAEAGVVTRFKNAVVLFCIVIIL